MRAAPKLPDPRTLLELRLIPGLGDRGLARILDRARSEKEGVEAAWSWAERWCRGRGRPLPSRSAVAESATLLRESCRAAGVAIRTRGEAGYPSALEALPDPPHVLFLRGRLELLESGRLVTVVGARHCTPTGRRTAHALARELAEAGVVVISGLALGVDGAAHRGALEGGGGTVAVLGSGVDVPHPPSHGRLFRTLARRGLLVSEFLPGTPPRAHHFPRRNRILAALPKGVVVVEAARRSGAIITANQAVDLGREVMAVPGHVEDPGVQGNLDLFRDGAKVVWGAQDVFHHLEWRWPPAEGPQRPWRPEAEAESTEQALILSALAESGPRTVEELTRAVGLAPQRVLTVVSTLEVSGRVTTGPDRAVSLPREPASSSGGSRPVRGRGKG